MNILKINVDCINDENKYKLFVYGLKNKITNKYYVGSTINKRGISTRIRRHIHQLKSNNHHSVKLQRSFNKYNQDFNNWVFILFEEITNKNYNLREQYYIDKFDAHNNGYNSTPLAGIINSGKMNDKHKKAISDSKQNMFDFEIIDIFQKYNNGLNYKEISKYYKLAPHTISTIINNSEYYPDYKKNHKLKKEWYSYVFYDLEKNKIHKVENFSKFCRNNNLNNKMMMGLMLGKLKKRFINNWTVFKSNEFSLFDLNTRIKFNENVHILYKNNIEYQFKSVRNFCNEHYLDETSTYHVLKGNKKSVKGFKTKNN